MIKRYQDKKVSKIWTEYNKFDTWLKIELAVCKYYFEKGIIPKVSYKTILENAKFDIDKITEIEEETHHDVLAFVMNVSTYIGNDSQYFHKGLTSSDIVDTALNILIRDSLKIIQDKNKHFIQLLKEKAIQNKETFMIGRTHGVHAEPYSLGLKFCVWYDEFQRHSKRLDAVLKNVAVGAISGAVGTYSNIEPELELFVCKELGLNPAVISTQIISRDIHGEVLSLLGLIAGTIEKIALQIRLLQRTECSELQEPFASKQKGSSAMPHKKNPVKCEQLCGLARVVRSNVQTALSNQALWDERDISHSSTERIIFPDSLMLVSYMYNRLEYIISGLVINKDRLIDDLNLTKGLVYSSKLLVELMSKGFDRDKAYIIVQENAMKSYKESISFYDLCINDDRLKDQITKEELDKIFDYKEFLHNLNYMYKKVFGEY